MDEIQDTKLLESVNYDEYSVHYSDKAFWKKVLKHYRNFNQRLLLIALELYYSFKDDDTPKWAKRIIIGALGYFIFPFDIVPDFIAAIGYSDDITALFLAVSTIALYIKPEHKKKAQEKVSEIFNRK